MSEVTREMLFMHYDPEGRNGVIVAKKHKPILQRLKVGDVVAQCDREDILSLGIVEQVTINENGDAEVELQDLDLGTIFDYKRYVQTSEGIGWTDSYPHRTTRIIPEFRCWGLFKKVDAA